MGAAAQQPNPGVAGQVPGVGQIDLALGVQRVDVLGGGLELPHPRPAGDDDVLGVVLVGGQAHRGGLDPKRNVLADQSDPPALGGKVGGAAQDPGIIAVGPEAGRQHRRVRVVELDVERTALCPNGNRPIQPSVLEPKIVEQAQRLSGEPTQLVVMAFGLQFADHHQRNHHLVFGEPAACPGVGQQHGGIEHVSPGIGHEALLGLTREAPHRHVGGSRSTRTGAGPALTTRVVIGGAALAADHVADHQQRRYSRGRAAAVQARRGPRRA